MMVAFWEENPNAPPMKLASKSSSSSSSTTASRDPTHSKKKSWIDHFNVSDETVNKELQNCKTKHYVNKRGVIHVDKIVEKVPEISIKKKRNMITLRPKKKLKTTTKEQQQTKDEEQKIETYHVDLLDSFVFKNFGALNSGMYIADPSIGCSLNCNGTCDLCRKV